MHFVMTLVAAVLGLSTLINAHMMMAQPTPFGKSTLDNSPLVQDGSDFPCKQRQGVYDADGANNQMALGSSQPLSFVGGATHGGGSCQISITYDKTPTKSSTFKVIKSFEGGCPAKNTAGNLGNAAGAADPFTYSFDIPTGLPTGDAVLAWTWFNKVGNREMYMNCAPVTLGGSGSDNSTGSNKRDGESSLIEERDQSFFNSLPNMFVANVDNGCSTIDSTDLQFPNPGQVVEKDGDSSLVPPSCTGSAATFTNAQSGAQPTGVATSGASQASTAGGVYATGVSSAIVSGPSSVPASSIDASPSASSFQASSVVSSSVAAAPTAATSGSSGNSSSGSSTGSSSGTCSSSQDGQSLCSGDGKQIGMCNAGNVVWMDVADGTVCQNGYQVVSRSLRFSKAHLHRRHNSGWF